MVIENMINHPLDTLKTRYQLILSQPVSQTPKMLSFTQSILKSEGILSLYRGLPPVILMQAPRGMIKFATNYSIQQKIYQNKYISNILSNDLNNLQSKTKQNVIFYNSFKLHFLNYISGVSTGIIDGLIVSPFEYIKVRMQSPKYINNIYYSNSFIAIYNILKLQKQGLRMLYIGSELTLWRNGLWHGIYFGCLGAQSKSADRFSYNRYYDFLIGCIGGAFGSLFSSPFDVAKSRIQNEIGYLGKDINLNNCNVKQIKIDWACKLVYNIYKTEGVLALYRGFAPKILRLGLGGGILMFSFEYCLAVIEYIDFLVHRTV